MISMRDFKVGWRQLLAEPGWSAMVLGGLAIGFAVCLLLGGYVRYALSVNHAIPDSSHLYQVTMRYTIPGQSAEWFGNAPVALRSAAVSAGIPAKMTMIMPYSPSLNAGGLVKKVDGINVDADFPEMFGVSALAGDLKQALARPDGLAITEKMAITLFGTSSVLGRTVLSGGRTFTVRAVVPTPSRATTVPYDVIAGFESPLWQDGNKSNTLTNWGSIAGYLVFKPLPGIPATQVMDGLQKLAANTPLRNQLSPAMLAELGNKPLIMLRSIDLASLYLAKGVTGIRQGSPLMLLSLAVTAALILLLAMVNYINLATVRTVRRQREIGVRKILGASIKRVAAQFIAESVLVVLMANSLGLLLGWLLAPAFQSLLGVTFDALFDVPALAVYYAVSVLCGVLAGAYPAWLAASVHADQALAGRGDAETVQGLWLRRVLTIVQFSVAMGLSAVTLAIAWQTGFAIRQPSGFEAEHVLVVESGRAASGNPAVMTSLLERLKHLPGIDSVAASMEAVGRNNWSSRSEMRVGNHPYHSMHWIGVERDFFPAIGVRPVAGRVFNPARDLDTAKVAVINRRAVKALGFSSETAILGQTLEGGGEAVTIIGVVPDLRHHTLRESSKPMVYLLADTSMRNVINIRISGDMATVRSAVEQQWRQAFPDEVFEAKSGTLILSDGYREELRVFKMLSAATVVALLLAAFGIYVLSAYSVQRRAREIVLRKLYGARRGDIARLISCEFVWLLGISAVTGLPVAMLAILNYLSGYVETAPIGGWTLLAALLVSVLVAALSTLRHLRSAMAMRPGDVLRGG